MAERLYSTRQVADLLGSTPAAVQQWIDGGWLAAARLPEGVVRVSETGLVRFLKDRGVNLEELMAATVLREAREGSPDAPAPPPPPHQPEPHAPRGAEKHEAPAAPADPAAQVIDAILEDAVQRRATAIHLEGGPDGPTLRLRIAGRLYEKVHFRARLPRGIGPELLAHTKALAGLGGADPGRTHEGTFARTVLGRTVAFRVSTCPTTRGEGVVIHVADAAEAPA